MDEQDIELLKTLIDTQNITKTAKKHLYHPVFSHQTNPENGAGAWDASFLSVPAKAFSLQPAAEGIFPKLKRIS